MQKGENLQEGVILKDVLKVSLSYIIYVLTVFSYFLISS